MFITLCCWIIVVMREKLELQMMIDRGVFNKKSTLKSSGRILFIFKDMAILSLHPYPFFVGKIIIIIFIFVKGYKFYVFNKFVHTNIYYHYNDILHMLSLVRLVYALNSILSMTKWKSSSAERIRYFYLIKI